ncbi:hypothetical protein ASC97_09005 [Rhizobium sp. Root1203]|uniref:GFA family protein n=1 Tax=Rhizobium sp. Root1203 TaxID=1736427 RepID=UPI00070F61D0|nr:GFA family protein [Rhizobium sp. Root1203]KQV28444.1 hypothetical protein ASC97_09005 [Rhizobium sp. Root1203]
MEQTDTTHRGGCLCGEIRYAIAEAPLRSSICHCRTCRRIASSPSLPFVVFPARTFVFESGEPRRFASSPEVIRTFCGRCGSPLTYGSKSDPDTIDVMTISLDRPEIYVPTDHVWVSEKIAWDIVGDDLPRHWKGRSDDGAAQ